MYKLILVSLSLLVSLTGVAKATVPLYEIDKPVETGTDAERAQLLPQALSDVLVKVTGDRRVTDNIDLQALVQDNAALALQRFKYINRSGSKKLHLQFSKKEIKRFLAKYHLTFWPKERPEVIIWLTYTGPEGNQWEFVTEDNKANFIQSLNRQAEWRGLPVNFPVLDLQDLQSLTDTQAITEQTKVLKTISQRYHADYVLAASISTDKTGEWRSQWKLFNNSETMNWEFSGKNMVSIFTQGIDAVADSIVERTAMIAEDKDSPKKLILSVGDVKSVEDYLKAMHYIQSVKGVARVEVAAVNNSQVNFEVFLSTDTQKDAFKKILQKESVLNIVQSDKTKLTNTALLNCRLGGEDSNQAVA